LYTEFRFKHLSFEYDTTAYSANATGASAGQILLVTQYNAAAANFASYNEGAQYFNFTEAVIYDNVKHTVRGKTGATPGFDNNRNYFVYNSNNVAMPTVAGVDDDIHDYNMGIFQVLTNNNAVTSEVGRLYVTYDVELIGPRLPIYSAPGPVVAKFTGTSTTGVTFSTDTEKSASSAQINAVFTANSVTISATPILANTVLEIELIQYATTSLSAATTGSVTLGTASPSYKSSTLSTVSTYGGTTTPSVCLVASTATTGGVWQDTFVTGTVTGSCTFDLIVTAWPLSLTIVESKESVLEKRLKAMEEKYAKLQVITCIDEEEGNDPAPPSSARSVGTPVRK